MSISETCLNRLRDTIDSFSVLESKLKWVGAKLTHDKMVRGLAGLSITATLVVFLCCLFSKLRVYGRSVFFGNM